MLKCPFCHRTYVNNTIFCNECGHYLLEDDKRETDPLEANRIGWVGNEAEEAHRISTAQLSATPSMIRLLIENKREVELTVNKAIWIGRMDPADDIFPEIDLTDDGPAAKSVSRRHARIVKRGETITIEDLGSVNGTFINRKKLSPYIPEKLTNGDVLQFGTLLMEIKMLK